MKKKYFLFSIIAILAISMGLVYCSVSGTEDASITSARAKEIADKETAFASSPEAKLFVDEAAFLEYSRNVNRSVEVYEKAITRYVINSVKRDGIERKVYSDDFAGVFLDKQGLLNICIVADDKQIKSLQTANSYGGQVVYKQRVFSYNYLQEIMDAVELLMLDYDIFSVGIDEELNFVSVELNDEDSVKRTIQHLREKGLYDEAALNFKVNPASRIKFDANYTYGGEAIMSGVLIGGMICINAVCNTTGLKGILTNAHIAPQGMDIYYRGYWDGSDYTTFYPLGNSLRAQLGGTVDAAFVPYANQGYWNVTCDVKYRKIRINNVSLGNNNQIFQGQYIRRIGQKTGITAGFILNANKTITISGKRFTNVFTYQNEGQSGDSGGPVFYNDSDTDLLFLVGMHFASDTAGYACRITNVMSTLNVTPITLHNIHLYW